MQGGDQDNSKLNLPFQLFADWFNPSTGRSETHKSALLQQYQSRKIESKATNLGQGLLMQLGKAADFNIQKEFQNAFIYGASLKIWRKGRAKMVEVFVDPFIPSLLWVSSPTKAFLFDLTYTTVERFDLQLQRASGQSHYIILHYFQESLPLVFNGAEEAERYSDLFHGYIMHNRCYQKYPPYFSRIIKLYTAGQARDSRARQRSAGDVMKVSQLIGLKQQKLNWQVLQAVVSKTQKKVLTDGTSIDHQQIGEYFKILHCCDGVKEIYQRYSGKKMESYLLYLVPLMTKQNFRQFLIFQQHDDQKTISEILSETRPLISFYDFCEFLLSEKSNYICLPGQVDESLPLTDYFCYSSHNTYLSGNQLTSDSKIERYLEDLEGGLKCVEIDVHNDGQKPIITHALKDKSLCKPIDFEETIVAMARFCENHPQHYPLIISIENHASDANRYKMFNILFHNFSAKLLLISSEDQSLVFKTLGELKGKIILKTDSNLNELLPYRKNLQPASPIKCEGKAFTLPKLPSKNFKNEIYRNKYQKFQGLIKTFQARMENFVTHSPKQLYLPLAEMTKITAIFKSPTGVSNQQSTGYECSSLTNEKSLKTGIQKILAYTKRSWLRIYPLASEIGSSNYDPVPQLQIGAQIIALNTQTKDSYAWLMMSYFTAGRPMLPGLLGFIPKPFHLRSKHPRQQRLKIYQISICSTNEKVTVKFYGTERDMKTNQNNISHQTFRAHDSNEGFLMFTINEKLRQCVPLRWVRQGYRVLIAKNETYRDSGIRVLVYLSIKDSLPTDTNII